MTAGDRSAAIRVVRTGGAALAAVVVALVTCVLAPPELGATATGDAAPARPTAPAGGTACPDARGVTVVVDATRLGGGVRIGCTPGAPGDGLQALRAAGFTVRGTARFPGFVCRIDDAPSSDPCLDSAPPDAYWAYWHAARGGAWTYSDAGATERRPPSGTVEGWVFSDGSGAPPSLAPPPVTPPAASPPAADPAPAPGVPTATPGAVVAGATTVPAAPPGAAVAPPAPTDTAPAAGVGAPGATPPPADPGGATDATATPPPDAAAVTEPLGEPPDDRSDREAETDAPIDSSEVAAGTDEASTGAGPLPVLAGLAVVAAVAGLGIVAARRRRVDPDATP